MAGYNGRRAMYPNLDNLNAIPSDPSAYNMVIQRQQDGYDLDQELAMFTNTQFFDFDQTLSPESQFETPTTTTQPHIEFLSDEFEIPDLHGVSSNVPHTVPSSTHQPPQQYQFQQQPYQSSNQSSSSSTPSQPTGEKRKLDTGIDSLNAEDQSRMAAEEDKRRRNTAASARFRAKKKQREEAMEKTAKEMTEKVTLLESRIAKLEMENKLLKDLITEKSGQEVDVAELYRRLATKGKEPAKRADKLALEASASLKATPDAITTVATATESKVSTR